MKSTVNEPSGNLRGGPMTRFLSELLMLGQLIIIQCTEGVPLSFPVLVFFPTLGMGLQPTANESKPHNAEKSENMAKNSEGF